MLDELERLLSAATPGPIDVTRFLGAWRGSPRDRPGFEYFDTGDGPRSEEDARLIAAAVNALPALLRLARASTAMRQADELCYALERTGFPDEEVAAARGRVMEAYEAWLAALVTLEQTDA